jgi:SPP1 family predicted phage head-tail adaptor
MRAGRLNKQITIISPRTTARSAEGAPIVTQTTVLRTWANVEPMIGSEMFRGDYRYADDSVKFTIRYSTEGIAPKMSVICTGSTYNIVSVTDSSNAHREMVLIATKTT